MTSVYSRLIIFLVVVPLFFFVSSFPRLSHSQFVRPLFQSGLWGMRALHFFSSALLDGAGWLADRGWSGSELGRVWFLGVAWSVGPRRFVFTC